MAKTVYITEDLVKKTDKKSIINAYERNELSVLVMDDSVWYVESCSSDRLYNTLAKEMARLYPDLVPYSEIRKMLGAFR